ncbi:MAG: hypothetical protein ACE5MK_02370 [Acidobacteriota bacterium]
MKGEPMDDNGKKNSRIKSAEQEKKAPVGWQLTEEDKAFLRSCNICPD